jgi:predicted ABC-type ATPase
MPVIPVSWRKAEIGGFGFESIWSKESVRPYLKEQAQYVGYICSLNYMEGRGVRGSRATTVP